MGFKDIEEILTQQGQYLCGRACRRSACWIWMSQHGCQPYLQWCSVSLRCRVVDLCGDGTAEEHMHAVSDCWQGCIGRQCVRPGQTLAEQAFSEGERLKQSHLAEQFHLLGWALTAG